MKWLVVCILAVVLVLYLAAGAYLFKYLEGTISNPEARNYTAEIANFSKSLAARYPSLTDVEIVRMIEEVLIAHSEGVLFSNTSVKGIQWDISTSFFFVSTVITTIGYGNVAPVTVGGRVATIFYGLVGIPLCLIFLSGLGEKIVLGFKRIEKSFACCTKYDSVCHVIRVLVLIAIGWVLFVMIPASIFMYTEHWTYIESVYFAFVTLSTIGFGDLVVSSLARDNVALYRVLTVIWLYMGLAWLSSLISLITGIMQQRIDEGEDKMEETLKQTSLGNKLFHLDSKVSPENEDKKYVAERTKEDLEEIHQMPDETLQGIAVKTRM